MPIDQGWRLSRRGLPLGLSDWTEVWPQVAHELTDRQGMEADLLNARLAVGLEFLRPYGTHFCLELIERVADNAFAACHGNIAAR